MSRFGNTFRRAVAVTAAVSLVACALPAAAQERREFRGGGPRWEEHREPGRRGSWGFESGRGWRFEQGPGLWSPFYVWWWINGVSVLGLAPADTVVRYPSGYYALRGDGISTPYYWIWVPTVAGPPPPPPQGPTGLLPPEGAPQPPPLQGQLQPPPPVPEGQRAAGGTIVGGAVGGVLGAVLGRGPGRIAGVMVGTLLGALVGHDIGRSLDEADELRTLHTLETNPTGTPSTWVNPDSGAQVTIVPRRTYQDAAGEDCREYQTEVTVGGQTQKAYGTACRQPDGQWKLVK